MSNFGRNLALWVIIALLLVVLFNLFQPGTTRTAATQVAYSDFINEVNGGRVRDVVIQGRTVSGQLTDGRTFQTYTPEDASLVRSPDRQGRAGDRQARGLRRQSAAALPAVLVPDAAADRRLGVLHAPDAGGRRPRHGVRQVARAHADGKAGARDVRRCGRHRRGEGRAAGDRRVPEGPAEIPAPGRQDPQGRAAGRPSRHRQDAAGARHRRRGERAVLHHLGFRLRRDVRGRRREPRARHVRAGQEERALHHLHRRNRCGRPASRRRPRRRQRRTRADAEPDAGRDGRLREQRGRHPDRRHQPAGRAGPGAAAAGPVRPPGGGAEPGRERAGEDPARAHAQGAAGLRRRSEGDRARHAGLLGRRSRQSGERGGAAGGPHRQARGGDGRVRGTPRTRS